MKDKIIYPLVGVVLAILSIFVFNYIKNQPEIPVVEKNGEINGSYTIEGIMKLSKPYICVFKKTDNNSSILGTLHTDGKNLYEEFKIKTNLVKVRGGFNSFLITKNKIAYTWTSLQNVGYKSTIAKSAIQNATPQEQAQIIGAKDKIDYKCKPWKKVDNSLFETPTWVTFLKIKK